MSSGSRVIMPGIAQLRYILCAVSALVVVVSVCSNSPAQEVASIDLTQVTQRTGLRRPSPTPETPGGANGAQDNHACADIGKSVGTLRTTLTALDRDEYQFGDQPTFEVTVGNAGSEPIQLPFSPHLADLQPADPSQKFSFSELSVVLWLGGNRWNANMGGAVNLYGADDHPETLLKLLPGEWLRIVGKGKINLPLGGGVADFISRGDAIGHANAQISVMKTEILITSSSSASVSRELCINKLQGPDVAITVTDAQR